MIKVYARLSHQILKYHKRLNKLTKQQVRVHDLKHTFGQRLRAAGVCFDDRKDLLGHKSREITTHYSAANLGNLINAANKVCDHDRQGPTLTVLRLNNRTVNSRDIARSRKSPAKLKLVDKYLAATGG